MPVRKPKPTSPGMRFVSYPDFAEITKSTPEKSLTEGAKELRRAQRPRTQDLTPPRRRGQARYRRIDFKRTKDGSPRRSLIEYDPNRSAYIALLHYARRREARHPRARSADRRYDRRVRTRRRYPRRQRLELSRHAGRYGRAQHRASARPRRPDGRSAGTGIQLLAKDGDSRRCACPPARCAWSARECRATVGDDRQLRPPERQDR